MSQYKLVDEASLASFQSGLRFMNGRAKPAYAAYRLPIWVVRRARDCASTARCGPAPTTRRCRSTCRAERPRGAAVHDRQDGHGDVAVRAVPDARAQSGRRAVAAGVGRRAVARGAGRSPMSCGSRSSAVALALRSCAPAARAASNLEVGMEDERLLLSDPTEAAGAVDAWAAAGVDVVRIHARWVDVSPGPNRMHRPRGLRRRQPALAPLRLGDAGPRGRPRRARRG